MAEFAEREKLCDDPQNCGKDELGGWVRIFPFDSSTAPRNGSKIMTVHDVKIGISRVSLEGKAQDEHVDWYEMRE